MAVVPPNLPGRDEPPEVGCRGEKSVSEGRLAAVWMRWAATSCLPEDSSASTKGPKSFPPFHLRGAAGAGSSSVWSRSPSLFSLPYLACRNQEIKIDGEQIALARSSLLKRVVAGKQLPNVKKLSGCRSDRALSLVLPLPACSPATPPGQRGDQGTAANESKWNRTPICFLLFSGFLGK